MNFSIDYLYLITLAKSHFISQPEKKTLLLIIQHFARVDGTALSQVISARGKPLTSGNDMNRIGVLYRS